MGKTAGAQAKLKKNVLEQSLCTGCGACVGLCPYQVIHADRTVQLFDCDLVEGKCHAFCPRTPTDYALIRACLFEDISTTTEIGPVQGFFLTRAVDPDLRSRAQHGGTVTALLALALDEGLIASAIVAGQNDDCEPEGRVVSDRQAVMFHAKSRFTVSPTLAAFQALPDGQGGKIGLVATPCQAQALAKIKTTQMEGYTKADSIGLVIGLFCGWTLAREKYERMLEPYGITAQEIKEMDIPSGRMVLALKTADRAVEVPLSDVDASVRTACRYCIDSTAEFADLSVGAARYGKDGVEMAGWNQVIVRSETGRQLLELAEKRGVLEIREAPPSALIDLKNAAAEKKRKALKKMVEKTGSVKKLMYLDPRDPVVKKYLK